MTPGPDHHVANRKRILAIISRMETESERGSADQVQSNDNKRRWKIRHALVPEDAEEDDKERQVKKRKEWSSKR
jgi:hypothetical protein